MSSIKKSAETVIPKPIDPKDPQIVRVVHHVKSGLHQTQRRLAIGSMLGRHRIVRKCS